MKRAITTVTLICFLEFSTGAASAGFTGMSVESLPPCDGMPSGTLVYRVYANFDDSGDFLRQLFSDLDFLETRIAVIDGTFYQDPAETHGLFAPDCSLIPTFPTLACDTYVTIATDCEDGSLDVSPFDWTFEEDQLVSEQEFINTTGPNGGTWTYQGSYPGQGNQDGLGRVLIGQFVTTNGNGIEGIMNLQYQNEIDGNLESFEYVEVTFEATGIVPTFPFDNDSDGDIDLGDFSTFSSCITPPETGGPLSTLCNNKDADQDGDVDLADFAEFVRAFTG